MRGTALGYYLGEQQARPAAGNEYDADAAVHGRLALPEGFTDQSGMSASSHQSYIAIVAICNWDPLSPH